MLFFCKAYTNEKWETVLMAQLQFPTLMDLSDCMRAIVREAFPTDKIRWALSEQVVCNASSKMPKPKKKNDFLPICLEDWNKYITFVA